MAEPIISCPKCGIEIPLTESLAAPMLAAVRKQYEDRLHAKDSEIAGREASLREQQAAVTKAQAAVDEQVADEKRDRAARDADRHTVELIRLECIRHQLERHSTDHGASAERHHQPDQSLAGAQNKRHASSHKQRA